MGLRWRTEEQRGELFMEPDKSSVAQGFARDLLLLRQRAGNPSYSTLERLSGHRLKRATVSDVLNGNRVGMPDWRFVSLFVEACRTAARESNLDVQELGSLADWKRHWDGAFIGVLDARFPGGGHLIPVARDRSPTLSAGVPNKAKSPDWGKAVGPARMAGQAGPAEAIAEKEATGAVEDTGAADAASPEEAADPGAAQSVQAIRPVSATWGTVPPRQTDFVGREAWMAVLRQRLVDGSGEKPLAVLGLWGIGKTQLAVEYAYRYAADYDLVWWIPCDNAQSIHDAMAGLRSCLGLAGVAKDEGNGVHADLFDILRHGGPRASWLLIFDNANVPEEVRHLVPPMGGHVLITSRNSSWEATGTVLELDVFTREESIEFLRRRMPRYNPAEAHRIAEAVGDLPLLLEHAVESRAAIDEYLARLRTDPLGLLDSQPTDYPATVAAQWQESLAWVREEAPYALDLLKCLCFLGSAPVPREALESGYFPQATIHPLLRDPMRRNRAIMMLRRAGLLRVDTDARTLTVPPVTRYFTRDMVAKTGEADIERARHDAHLLLAAADPRTPEDPAYWRAYEQLRGHAIEADAQACSDEAVRRLIINLVRFQNAAGDPHAALRLADSALRRWTPDGPPPSSASPADFDAHLAMRGAKVDALFSCGRHQEAFRFQQETLALMLAAPGDWGDEITLLGRVTGARSRMLGRFADGLAADEQSRVEHVARFGRDDPRSFAVAGAVILDLALTGQSAEAVREARRVYADCLAFYGDPGYPAVLFQRNMLARCLWLHGRQHGRYDEAMAVMADAHAGYRALAVGGILDENHPWHLTHEVDYAVLRRDSLLAQHGGALGPDPDILAAHLHDTRRRCWRVLTANHPQTLAATVALGSVLRRLPGRTAEAVRVLAEAERRYQSALPDHPFTRACTEYLATLRDPVPTGDAVPNGDAVPTGDAVANGNPAVHLDFTPLPL
jgi:hypothetical protein